MHFLSQSNHCDLIICKHGNLLLDSTLHTSFGVVKIIISYRFMYFASNTLTEYDIGSKLVVASFPS